MRIRNSDGNEFLWRLFQAARLLLVGLMLGCARDVDRTPPPARLIIADLILSVDNRVSSPFVIYLDAAGITDSLGSVPGRAVKSFSVPSHVRRLAPSTRLVARNPRGVTAARSSAFNPSVGHQIIWTLDRSANGSVTIR